MTNTSFLQHSLDKYPSVSLYRYWRLRPKINAWKSAKFCGLNKCRNSDKISPKQKRRCNFYSPFKTVMCFRERIPSFLLFRTIILKTVQTLVTNRYFFKEGASGNSLLQEKAGQKNEIIGKLNAESYVDLNRYLAYNHYKKGVAMNTSDRPNILWISVEDTTPRFGCYGDTLARTPNIDRLAAGGCRFPNAFSTAGGVCPEPFCNHYGYVSDFYRDAPHANSTYEPAHTGHADPIFCGPAALRQDVYGIPQRCRLLLYEQ